MNRYCIHCQYADIYQRETKMKLAIFTALLLVGLVNSAPTSNRPRVLLIDEQFFQDKFLIYEGQHDIIRISLPLNAINFSEDSSSESDENSEDATIFVVEADVKDGVTTYQGLYVKTDGKVKKLLDNGRDVDAPRDDSKNVYFAASDGLYSYNQEKNQAEKYGTLNEEFKAIVLGNNSTDMFVITPENKVYKITENGNSKILVEEIDKAEQIVLDDRNHIFYVSPEKEVYVVKEGAVTKIEGLPENPTKVTLIRPPFVFEKSVPLVVDNKGYIVHSNGTSELQAIEVKVPITAYSLEATLLHYYAKDKKVYGYDILTVILGNMLTAMKNFFDGMKTNIQSIATRSRMEFTNRA